MKQKITQVSFLILVLVCILPPVIHGYWYPNQSDDTANNISVITRMCQGTLPSFEFRYWGYAILGYPLWFLAKIFHVTFPIMFMWFSSLLPAIVGLVLYFVFSRLVNWTAGILSLVVPVFVCGATVYYMYFGILFNMLNLMILYPLLIYFVVKWFTEHRVYQLLGVIIFTFLVSVFHVSGLYLPFVVGLALVVYLVYARKKLNKKVVILGLGLVAIGIVGIIVVPYTRLQVLDVIKGIHGGLVLETPKSIQMDAIYKSLVPASYFVTNFISTFVLVLFGFCVFKYKDLKMSVQSKLFLFLVGCLAVVLLVTAYAKLSTIPFRQQTDLAIVFALLTTGLVGILAHGNKKTLLIVVLVIAGGLYPQFVPSWFQDNSAIKEADKQTIEYVNTLGYTNYDCSPTVSQLIYDDYLDAKYQADSQILIVRNVPMTQGSNSDNVYYDGHGTESTEGYNLDKTFNDGDVEVQIFRRDK